MRMAPVNPSDFNYMDGIYERSFARMIWNRGAERPTDSPGSSELFPRPPYALGVEGVGVVEESGGGFLGRRLVGKRVAVVSGPPNGTWQEQTLIDARRAFPVPRSLSDAQACSFFVNPLTALVLVRHVLQVPRGSVLLQTAAGSALSQMVRNLAREDGFRVIDVVRSRAGAERLKQGNASTSLPWKTRTCSTPFIALRPEVSTTFSIAWGGRPVRRRCERSRRAGAWCATAR